MSVIYSMVDTWNAIGTTFDAIKMNVSNGAGGAPVGAAASRLFNLQANGTTVFDIDVSGFLTKQFTNALGTITTSQPFTITQTWNAGAVTFNALLVNATSTASATASTLIDLQVGGASKFSVTKAGNVVIANNYTSTSGDVALMGASSGGVQLLYNAGQLAAYVDNAGRFIIGGSAASCLAFGSAATSGDLFLLRDAANTLAQRNGTTAQKFSVYNTFTDASNYERGIFDWAGTSNVLTIGTENAGTGVARNWQLVAGGVGKFNYGVTDAGALTCLTHLRFSPDNTLNLGANGSLRPANIYAATSLDSAGYIAAQSATAIPAGGTAGKGYRFSSASNFGVFFGSGAPTLAAAQGSLYLRSDGTTVNNRAYINTDGNTTWAALTTAA